MNSIEIVKPDDFHLHIRQGDILKSSLKDLSPFFARAIIMPNTIPPVASVETLEKYRNEILEASNNFIPLMTFKILKSLKTEDIRSLKKAGAIAGKFFPAGSTTNSSDGISNWRDIKDLIRVMSDEGLVLCIHGEDPSVFSMDREAAFVPQILEICTEFPQLKVVFEHLSTADGIDAVKNGPDNLAGTITVHHLLLTLDDVIGGGIEPHNFCKPILKRPEDRDAIQKAALSGSRKFFFGSDSAPHLIGNKENSCGSAGCYTSPVALPLLAQFLDDNKKLCLNSGQIIALTPHMTMMFEVEDLAVASPATVSRCGMVYMEPESLTLKPLIDSWMNTIPEKVKANQYIVNTLQKLFDDWLEDGAYFVRKNCPEIVKTVSNNLAMSLMRLLDCYMADYIESEAKKVLPDHIDALAGMIKQIFTLCFVWSLGATTTQLGRERFDKWIRDQMKVQNIDFPEDKTVYDWFWNAEKKDWVSWFSIIPEYKVDIKMPYNEIVVPTLDSIRMKYIIKTLVKNMKHV
ncbi:MAG: dihydroorotase, partial [Proteobacteria bacterium]|nr:dihydroorotase [Pseudomonadota bacterium]